MGHMLQIALATFLVASHVTAEYNVGVGIADMTGPAAEINMMGYVRVNQTTAGIHTRTFSRAFIFQEPGAPDPDRVVFVSVDICMTGQLLKMKVLEDLEALYPGVYRHENVLMSATHNHSAAGGFLQYFSYLASSLGFVDDSFQAYRKGIVKSIVRAHESMRAARVYLTAGELYDSSINRSPTAYELNPAEERALYDDNVDKEFTQLVILSADDDTPIGVINWFAVHGVSMLNTNNLISSDNKGWASVMFEKSMNPEGSLVGEGPFVAAFASSNLGDVSPNLSGAFCLDPDQTCDPITNTCGTGSLFNYEPCYAVGPGGGDMFESTYVIAERQLNKAMELFDDVDGYVEVTGPISFIHQFVDMENRTVTLDDGSTAQTCTAAMGYSMWAGPVDGPTGQMPQAETEHRPFVDGVTELLFTPPTPEQEACHEPKPILINCGSMKRPYAWAANIVDTQIIKIGGVVIAALPGEFTTMSGRRLRNAMWSTATDNDAEGEISAILLSGLSNVYTDYITTFEEYQQQRYEGASTIYGPHTQRAHQQQYASLFDSLLKAETVEPGPNPPDLYDVQVGRKTDPKPDSVPGGTAFGDVVTQPEAAYVAGETVTARFRAGNPWLASKVGDSEDFSTFVKVEQFDEASQSWVTKFSDADWETKFIWEAIDEGIIDTEVESQVVVEWQIPNVGMVSGLYKITHQGYFALAGGFPTFYSGETLVFSVEI